MKKLFTLLLMLTLLLSSVAFQTAHAKTVPTATKKIIFQKQEITDLNTLFNRAINGKSDISTGNLRSSIKLSDDKDNIQTNDINKPTVNQYITAQVLKESQTNTGVEKDIAVTTFVTVNPLVTSSTRSGSKWDSSYAVKAYSTIYYSSKIGSNGMTYYKLTRAKGGWTNGDSSISLSGRKVVMGCSGNEAEQRVTHYPSGMTWDYYAPSSWVYVSGVLKPPVGATSYVTLKRGGSTWTLTYTNNM